MKKVGSVLGILTFLAAACSPKPPVTHDPFGLQKSSGEFELESTVIVLDPLTRAPHCSGFAILFNGEPSLVTAAHCVTHPDNSYDLSPFAKRTARIGDSVFFITRAKWNGLENSQSEAHVTLFDPVHDRAVMLPVDDSVMPAPIPVVGLCERCLLEDYDVHYVSALYGWERHSGKVTGRVIEDGTKFWSSSASIWFGWSGSPAINNDGQAIGIVVKCEGREYPAGRQCVPGWSLFTEIR